MSESTIQSKTDTFARSQGWQAYPFRSANHRGVPDRIYFKGGTTKLIEFKAEGKKPSPLQEKCIADLRREGMEVHVIDNVDDGKAVFIDGLLYPKQELLKQYFDYDAEGYLIHKERIDKIGRPNIRYAGKRAGTLDTKRRWRISVDGQVFEAHRLVWIWHNGEIPVGHVVDHINGDPSDNRIENLRTATTSQNNANRNCKKNNATSQYFGVYKKDGTQWVAQAKKDGEVQYIGCFKTELEAAQARDSYVRGLHDGFEKLNFPDQLNRFDLHDYQERAVEFVKGNPFAALWIEMGLGKSVITLTALVDLLEEFEFENALVIAPKRVALSVWPQETAKWAHTQHLTTNVLAGASAKRRESLRTEKADITVINRENVEWLANAWGQDWPYDLVVIDESSRFKSHRAKRFKALKKVRNKVTRMIQLTGTPASNGLHDLWSQVYLLDGGERLGRTITKYRDTYFTPDYMGYNYLLKKGSKEKIYSKLDDIVLTLSSEDYIDLPDRIDNLIELEMPTATAKQYKDLERDFLLELEDAEVAALHAASLTNKLLQFANGAIYVGEADERETVKIHDIKLDALGEIIDGAEGSPVLVAYNYQSDAARIKDRFKQAVILDDDPKTIDKWNTREIPLLLAHPASAGHGLNLQKGGNTLVWFGLNWSLELYQQFNKRLHRQGQEASAVIVHHLIVKGTVDETVMAALGSKNLTQKALLDALKKDAQRRVK